MLKMTQTKYKFHSRIRTAKALHYESLSMIPQISIKWRQTNLYEISSYAVATKEAQNTFIHLRQAALKR